MRIETKWYGSYGGGSSCFEKVNMHRRRHLNYQYTMTSTFEENNCEHVNKTDAFWMAEIWNIISVIWHLTMVKRRFKWHSITGEKAQNSAHKKKISLQGYTYLWKFHQHELSVIGIYHIFLCFHSDFKYIALFCLHQEEEHRLKTKQKQSRFIIWISTRQWQTRSITSQHLNMSYF